MIYFPDMTLETQPAQTPDPKTVWRKINLLEQECVDCGLTDEDKKAIEIRELCYDIALAANAALHNPEVDDDPEIRAT